MAYGCLGTMARQAVAGGGPAGALSARDVQVCEHGRRGGEATAIPAAARRRSGAEPGARGEPGLAATARGLMHVGAARQWLDTLDTLSPQLTAHARRHCDHRGSAFCPRHKHHRLTACACPRQLDCPCDT